MTWFSLLNSEQDLDESLSMIIYVNNKRQLHNNITIKYAEKRHFIKSFGTREILQGLVYVILFFSLFPNSV